MSNSVSVKAEINFVYKVDGIEHLNDNYKRWILKTIHSFNYSISELNFTFMSDDDLLYINRAYLDHDYYTDIITFDQSESEVEIAGDIYISIERVKDNAPIHHNHFNEELDRLLVHGILHLCGFSDQTDEEKLEMRKKEDACLSLR